MERRRTPGRAGAAMIALGLSGLLSAGCEHRPLTDPASASPTTRLEVRLPARGGEKPRVGAWIARPRPAPARPLVLQLTGDGGWEGLDLVLFTALSGWGYPVGGLSSPAWKETLTTGVATPESLAHDLDRVARAAARATGVAEDDPFVIVGLSRGAGLAVEAAGVPSFRARLRGIVVLGLCPTEERVRRGDGEGRPYRDLRLLADLPVEVIQSTHDRHLSAAAARVAFGPDDGERRLHAIAARSHTFVGGRPALLDQLRASLERLDGR